MSQSFDIIIDNVPARLLFSELDKKRPGKSTELTAELIPVLLDLFARKNLREAIEIEAPHSVNVLTEKQFKKKRKSYNPKRDTYDVLESIVGDKPPRWWKNEGSALTKFLPKLKELFGGRDIVVRFRRVGTLDEGITEEHEREVAENIVLNFVGDVDEEEEEEEEAKPAAAPGPRPRAPAVPAAPVKSCETLLSDTGITSRKDFLRWSVRNHPDKGGDTKTFQEISACVDKQYGSGRKTRRREKKHRSTHKSMKSSSSGRV